MNEDQQLTLAFHGAAGTVTGSRFVVQAGNDRILVDCGLFQGGRDERQLNWQHPGFDARSIDAVLITHAHLDHSGYLPRLFKLGFRGKVFSTKPTQDLLPIVLRDAATLEEEDAEYANRKGYSRHRPALPLFTVKDADAVIRRLEGIPLHAEHATGGFRFRFHHAGHILGAAVIELWVPGQPGKIVFSGDLGRHGVALHVDPDPRPECDTLVLESTYGNRLHHPQAMERELLDAITPPLRRGGVVLLPAFAVARAQLLALLLEQLMADGKLPTVPVHIDSPMAVSVTDVYEGYEGSRELDPVAKRRAKVPEARLHRTRDESRALVGTRGPAIVIASSGMLAGGRVLHHLRWIAPSARNAIVLTGFQARGTRGWQLAGGARELRVHGTTVPVEAEVVMLNTLSAHADQDELVGWAVHEPRPQNVFLVHGEPDASEELGARLKSAGMRVHRPYLHQRYARTEGGWRSS
jgi:metallo-beta-lactamase family protein